MVVFAVILGAEGKRRADQCDGNAKGAEGCREIEIVDGLGRVGDCHVIERDQDDGQRKERCVAQLTGGNAEKIGRIELAGADGA